MKISRGRYIRLIKYGEKVMAEVRECGREHRLIPYNYYIIKSAKIIDEILKRLKVKVKGL